MDRQIRKHAQIACYGLVMGFALLSARLIHLHDTRYDEYVSLAASRHSRKQIIPATRGDIVDRQGVPLAISRPLKVMIADGSLIADPQVIADEIGDLLGMPREELLEKLQTKKLYQVVRKEIPESVAAQIQERLLEKRLRGIHFEQSARRVYPNDNMLCHIVGYVNSNLLGVQGVELTMEKYLRGRDGFRFVEQDRLGREIVPYRGQERPPRPGYHIRLTVDMGIQNIVEEEMGAAFQKYNPEVATALMMDPKTGRIMAMVNFPNYNPNEPGKDKGAGEANAAVINIVEPGSTFKIVTAAAALDDGKVQLSTMINCEGGLFHYGGGKPLKDHGRGPFPNLSVEDVLVRSSNIGAAKLALKMGENRFYSHLRSFGFGEQTGIALPGEVRGIVHAPGSAGWNNISITRMPIGQGVATTPIQMVTAVSAIANGGNLMMPQVVEEVFDDEGKTVVAYEPTVVRRVVSEETTQLVKKALANVVTRGTAKAAAVKGFTAAGKTGTAEKAAKNGGYAKGKYVVSFIGYMPAENPRFVLLVLLDDCRTPHGSNYGGTIAAPIFSRIAERTAHYLGMQPDIALPDAAAKMKLTQASR